MKFLSGVLNRVLLCSAGLGLLGWGAAQATPHFTGIVAAKAVINGSIVTLQSPIAGRIQSLEPLESGNHVHPQQLFFKVLDTQTTSDWIRNAQLALATEKAKLVNLTQQLSAIAADSSGLLVPAASFPATAIEVAIQSAIQAKTELESAQILAQQAQARFQRLQTLSKEGAISAIVVTDAQTQAQVLAKQVHIARAKLQMAQLQVQEQQHLQQVSATPKLDAQAVRSRQQRIEFVQQQQAELRTAIAQRELTIAQAQRTQAYEAISPVSGVIWEMLVQNGAQVTPGQSLVKVLNCHQRWVDAYVSVDDLQRIEIGDPATVELDTRRKELRGIVKTIRPRAVDGQNLGQDAAAPPPSMDVQQLAQLRIELRSATAVEDNRNQSANFCQVGKLVKVKIHPESETHPILNAVNAMNAMAANWTRQ